MTRETLLTVRRDDVVLDWQLHLTPALEGMDDIPALAYVSSRLYAAWRVGEHLRWGRGALDGSRPQEWTHNSIPDAITAKPPALCATSHELILVFVGKNTQHVFYSIYSNGRWSKQSYELEVDGKRISAASTPSIASSGDTVYIAYEHDGSTLLITPRSGTALAHNNWHQVHAVPRAPRPTIACIKGTVVLAALHGRDLGVQEIYNVTDNHRAVTVAQVVLPLNSVALCELNDELWIAWNGPGPFFELSIAWVDLKSESFAGQRVGLDASTMVGGPALTASPDKLIAGFHGKSEGSRSGKPCLFYATAPAPPVWRFTVTAAISRQTAGLHPKLSSSEFASKVVTQLTQVNEIYNNHFDPVGDGFDALFSFQLVGARALEIFDGPVGDRCGDQHPGADYLLVYDERRDEPDANNPDDIGGWMSGNKVIRHLWWTGASEGAFGDPATIGIAHEFAHARGAIDLGWVEVQAGNNRVVSDLEWMVPWPNTIMGTPMERKPKAWDPYTSHVINQNNTETVVHEIEAHARGAFPRYLKIRVTTRRGQSAGGVTVRVYAKKWNNAEVSPSDELHVLTTDHNGLCALPENPFLLPGDGAYGLRYPNFLVVAENVGNAWMPLPLVQLAFYAGHLEYIVEISGT